MKQLLYNYLNTDYKSPSGGIFTRREVKFVFPVAEGLRPDAVDFILRKHEYSTVYHMKREGTNNGYVNFSLSFMPERDGVYFYRFEIKAGDATYFIGRDRHGDAIIGDWLPEWQLTVSEDGYSTPDAIKGGVIYQIFPDRFNKVGGAKKLPYGVLKDWDKDVTIVDPDGVYRANDFFGGNFAGIKEKLGYLSDLCVTAIYLNPIFLSHSNHRYDTADYMKVDTLLGTEEDFKDLISAAKKRGISIVLDGVFNHTGADSIYFNKFNRFDSIGAYQSKDSPYYDWFTFYDFPDEYHCWWGITVVPTVAGSSQGYQNFIAGKGGVLEKWTKLGVKGWRLDVVDELISPFVKEIRAKIKEIDPNCTIIGEVWEDASTKHSYGEEREYFRGRELDGVMNYVFKDAIIKYILTADGETFACEINDIINNYPRASLDVSMTIVDSHDTVRIINILSGINTDGISKGVKKDLFLTKEQYNLAKKRLFLASSLQYFLPGLPTVYYGDEIGLQGFEDPLNRRPFPWGREDLEIITHYKMLGSLRKNNKTAFLGDICIHGNGNEVKIELDGLCLTVNAENLMFSIKNSNKK